MNYCPKCGNKLNENDKFCPNCGAKIVDDNIFEENSSYSSPKPNNTLQGKTHVLCKISLIFSIIALVAYAIAFTIAFAYYNDAYLDNTSELLIGLFGLIAIMLSIASLGTGIPGYIINKKRGGKFAIAITSLVLAIIAGSILLFMIVIAGIAD